jgi:hypothetical protein
MMASAEDAAAETAYHAELAKELSQAAACSAQQERQQLRHAGGQPAPGKRKRTSMVMVDEADVDGKGRHGSEGDGEQQDEVEAEAGSDDGDDDVAAVAQAAAAAARCRASAAAAQAAKDEAGMADVMMTGRARKFYGRVQVLVWGLAG